MLWRILEYWGFFAGQVAAIALDGASCGAHPGFLNARNLRYQPYGEWDHFPPAIFGQSKATMRRDSHSESSDRESSSGSSLTFVEEDYAENDEEDCN